MHTGGAQELGCSALFWRAMRHEEREEDMAAKFTMSFDMDNAAFEDNSCEEVARILRDVAHRVERTDFEATKVGAYGVVRDISGNRIGSYSTEVSND